MSDGFAGDSRASHKRAGAAINERVKVLAHEKGTSVAALSRDLHGNRSSLRNSFMRASGPSLATLLWLSARFGFHSIEELFGDFGSASYVDAIREPGSGSSTTGEGM